MRELWSLAREAGFAALAVLPVTEFSALLDVVPSRPGYEEFSHLRRLADARETLPSARSIILVVRDYSKIPVPHLVGRISRLYLSFSDPADFATHPATGPLVAEFDRRGWKTSTSVPRREAAVAAGLLVQRRNCLGYLPGGHSFLALYAWAVDAELTPAKALRGEDPAQDVFEPLADFVYPPVRHDPCGNCRLCLEACPTGALVDPFVLDPRRCIDRNTWRVGERIPRELRPRLGPWLYGCDACQTACPHNRRAGPVYGPEEPAPGLTDDLLLAELAAVGAEAYSTTWSKYFVFNADRNDARRNVIVALGNRGEPAAEAVLLTVLQDDSPVLRGHAAWALGRLGTATARQALEDALHREEDEQVREELTAALQAPRP